MPRGIREPTTDRHRAAVDLRWTAECRCKPGQGRVVDDEVFARLFASPILLDRGYQPLEAETTVESLDVLDTHEGVSLLITDLCIAGDRDGLALARKVARDFPGINIIIVFGQMRPHFVDIPLGAKFFPKPYTAHELTSAIEGN